MARARAHADGLEGWFDKAVVAVALTICVLVVALTAVSLAMAHAGYHVLTMQTSSMVPVIKPGDLVLVEPVPADSIRVGDIITFDKPVGATYTLSHRVVYKQESASGPVFQTRGDANSFVDPWHLRFTQTGWKVASVLRGVGGLLAWLGTDGGKLLAGVLTFWLTFMLIRPADRRKTAPATVLPEGAA